MNNDKKLLMGNLEFDEAELQQIDTDTFKLQSEILNILRFYKYNQIQTINDDLVGIAPFLKYLSYQQ